MERVEKTIEVGRPLRTVYNQWTQFEDFPEFMAGVKEVRQIDDTHVHWHAEIWGKDKEWDAEIVEQVPDQCIAWRSTSGAYNAGTVRFEPLGPDRTSVRLEMAYEPEGVVENVADAVGIFSARVQHTVEDFKEFIEHRNQPTGAWRGEVHSGLKVNGGAAPENPDGDMGDDRVPGAGTGATAGSSGTEGRLERDPNVNARGTAGKRTRTISRQRGHAAGHAEADVPNDAWPFQQEIKKP
jgi:ribosome-associated toxin RatA of RatAB toxin-antitoxin module